MKSDFREIFLKLVANDRSDKRFLLTSKFCPLWLSAPDLQLYTFIKSWKNVYKSEVEEIRFLLTSKFCPLWLSAPDLQLYTFIKSWKDVYKSEVEEILFKLATNDHNDEAFLLTSKFLPYWVVCPYPRAMFKLFSSITADFNISSALRWAIQDQWSSGVKFLTEWCPFSNLDIFKCKFLENPRLMKAWHMIWMPVKQLKMTWLTFWLKCAYFRTRIFSHGKHSCEHNISSHLKYVHA